MSNFTFSPYPSVYYAHLTGALVTFTGGIISAGLQAALTRLMHPEIVEMKMFWYRVFIAITGVIFYVTAFTTGMLAHIDRDGKRLDYLKSLLFEDPNSNLILLKLIRDPKEKLSTGEFHESLGMGPR